MIDTIVNTWSDFTAVTQIVLLIPVMVFICIHFGVSDYVIVILGAIQFGLHIGDKTKNWQRGK